MSLQQKTGSGLKEKTLEGGTYSHVFVYRVPKKNHVALLELQEKLRRIYKRHGMLGSVMYQLGKSNVFEGFASFEKALGTGSDDEIWIEVDSYQDANEFAKLVQEIGQDADAGPLWGELMQITTAYPIIMGEFGLLSRI